MNISILEKCPLFKNMDANNISLLLNELGCSQHFYQKGSYILHPGDKQNKLAILLSGSLAIEQEDFMGNRNLLTKLFPLDLFNEVFACANQSSNVHVFCESDVSILFIQIQEILEFPQHNEVTSQLCTNLLQIMAKKNLYLNAKVMHLSKRSIEDKVISFLSTQAQLHHSSSFTIPYNRQQLADYLSVDRSALSNTLSKLQTKGYLQFHKNHFTIHPHIK